MRWRPLLDATDEGPTARRDVAWGRQSMALQTKWTGSKQGMDVEAAHSGSGLTLVAGLVASHSEEEKAGCGLEVDVRRSLVARWWRCGDEAGHGGGAVVRLQ